MVKKLSKNGFGPSQMMAPKSGQKVVKKWSQQDLGSKSAKTSAEKLVKKFGQIEVAAFQKGARADSDGWDSKELARLVGTQTNRRECQRRFEDPKGPVRGSGLRVIATTGWLSVSAAACHSNGWQRLLATDLVRFSAFKVR